MALLTVSNLSKFFGAEEIFSDISFRVAQKARIGLVGANGVGKTTLLRILIGEETASDGLVQFTRGIKVGYLQIGSAHV